MAEHRSWEDVQHESFIARFFVTVDGVLHCRITDVRRGQTWTAPNARDLRALIKEPEVSGN
jgi:hypothetical protein